MPAPDRRPNHHRRGKPAPQRKAPPLPPLVTLIREPAPQGDKRNPRAERAAAREFWRQQDAKQAQRPDYLLWRQLFPGDHRPEKRLDVTGLIIRALRAPEPEVLWGALALAPAVLRGAERLPEPRRLELLKTLGGCLKSAPTLSEAPLTTAAVRWLVTAETTPGDMAALQNLLSGTAPNWKPGRPPNLAFLQQEGWLPVPATVFVRRLAATVSRLAASAPDGAAWRLSAWLLLRDLRRPHTPAAPEELEALLDAAQLARANGDYHGAAGLAALFAHLLPPKSPDALLWRAKVMAWFLAEAGMTLPPHLRVSFEDLPFPGEPAETEKGREAELLFKDSSDPFQTVLAREVADDAEWQRLRSGGVALTHPLAALAWVAKKAQSYAVKKQHDLLGAAFALALRHHCLTTASRILAHMQASPEILLSFARHIREALRHAPLLRDFACWHEWTLQLRAAWGRMEADAIAEPEDLFLLHETLADREVTMLRFLPEETRLLALRHLHNRRPPGPLVQAIEADPRLLQPFEHQRAVELWSISSETRERQDLAGVTWASLVARGDAASGKFSWLVQTAGQRKTARGRAKDGWLPVLREFLDAAGSADLLLLAIDSEFARPEILAQLQAVGHPALAAHVPTLEWAFRVLRDDAPSDPAGEVWIREGREATLQSATLPGFVVLDGGDTPVDAATRWHSGSGGDSRRSLAVSAHPAVVSLSPVTAGTELAHDLTRLCLANETRLFFAATGRYQTSLAPIKHLTPQALSALNREHWRLHGLPWLRVHQQSE